MGFTAQKVAEKFEIFSNGLSIGFQEVKSEGPLQNIDFGLVLSGSNGQNCRAVQVQVPSIPLKLRKVYGKGRGMRGVSAPRALSQAILRDREQGMGFSALAKKYHLGVPTVHRILDGNMPIFDFDGVTGSPSPAKVENGAVVAETEEEAPVLPVRPPKREKKSPISPKLWGWVRRCYSSGRWPVNVIAKKFGIHNTMVSKACSDLRSVLKKNRKLLEKAKKQESGTVPEPKEYHELPQIPAGGLVVKA